MLIVVAPLLWHGFAFIKLQLMKCFLFFICLEVIKKSLKCIFVSIRHSDTLHNVTLHKYVQHYDTRHKDIQHNDTQHKGIFYDSQHTRNSA